MSEIRWTDWFADAGRDPLDAEKRGYLCRKAQEYWGRHDAEGLHVSLPSNRRVAFLVKHLPELKRRNMYERMLFETYIHDPQPSPDAWKHLFECADRELVRACGDPLPAGERFVVYRGTPEGKRVNNRRGLSWTLSPHTAAWFAHRFPGPHPVVLTLTVPRENVLFFRHGEQELGVEIWKCDALTKVEPMPLPIKSTPQNAVLMQHDLMKILRYAQERFTGGPHSVHGPEHWQRVLKTGLSLANSSGTDVVVVALFALLHDVCRHDDGTDPGHGRRAADLCGTLQSNLFTVTTEQLAKLQTACRLHTAGKTTRDVTIGTCWDADRLDLGRVGTVPERRFMSTAAGRAQVR